MKLEVLLVSSILLLTATAADAAVGLQDDYLITVEGQILIFDAQDLLANDSFGSEAAHISIDSLPQFGSFREDKGHYIYEPNPGFVGEDQLTYRVTIGIQSYGTAVVTLKVSPATISIAGDFDTTPGPLDLGWFDSAAATFHHCQNHSCLSYESYQAPATLAGLTPVVGDWNGDGTEDMGLYDPAGGTFYLLKSLGKSMGGMTLLAIDSQFQLGNGGGTEIPVAGDWDGDGDDTAGLYRPAEQKFLLRDTNAWGPFDYDFVFSHPPDREPLPMTVKGTTPVGDGVGHYDELTRVLVDRAPTPGGPLNQRFDCTDWQFPSKPLWAGQRSGGFQLWLYDDSLETAIFCDDEDGTVEVYLPPTG